jgi:hypothetical protein
MPSSWTGTGRSGCTPDEEPSDPAAVESAVAVSAGPDWKPDVSVARGAFGVSPINTQLTNGV